MPSSTPPAQLPPVGRPPEGYRLLVADPPWENASVKRSAAYPALPARQLLRLPLRGLLHQDAVVLLWITNREKLHRFVAEELLAAWGLTHCTTWYWLKLGSGGHAPISSLASMHRHPFEHLLVLRPSGRCPSADRLPRSLVIMSCPAEHSRKPHLGRLIARLLPSLGAMGQLQPGILPARPLNLELFARDMHAGWDAVGNEVLTFQRAELFYPM
ncbi:MT-A70 [Haematococcus lacustris]